MNEKELEKQQAQETDFQINIVEYSRKTLQFGLYSKLSQFERHLDTISTRYKNMSLTWLLATFAGIGFLLSSETSKLPFSIFIPAMLIAFLGIIGNSLLWHLDINVYDRLWASIIVEQSIMEQKCSFLFFSKSIDLAIDKERERFFSHSLPYMATHVMLTSTLAILVFFYLKNYHLLIRIGSLIFFSAILIIAVYFMSSATKKIKKDFDKLLKEKQEGIHKAKVLEIIK